MAVKEHVETTLNIKGKKMPSVKEEFKDLFPNNQEIQMQDLAEKLNSKRHQTFQEVCSLSLMENNINL